MAFLEQDWLIPDVPLYRLQELEDRIGAYFEQYCGQAERLTYEGWSFFDFTGESAGSVAYLVAHGNFPMSWASGNAWSDWCGAFPPTYYARRFPVGVSMSRYLRQLVYASLPDGRWTDDLWNVYRFFALLGTDQEKFLIGWMQRFYCRAWQVQIAMTLRNIYGLDNRGRPRDA